MSSSFSSSTKPLSSHTEPRSQPNKTLCSPICKLKRVWNNPPLSTSAITIQDEHAALKPYDNTSLTQNLYQPLLPYQIRVLKVNAADSSPNEVQCRLIRATLIPEKGARPDEPDHPHDVIEFDALSYCWGHPLFTCSIVCNGVRFPVTRHLKEALVNLVVRDRTRYIWVDAFCINQQDNVEKGQQVQLMFTIFRQAQKVIGWFGNPTLDDIKFLGCLAIKPEDHHHRQGEYSEHFYPPYSYEESSGFYWNTPEYDEECEHIMRNVARQAIEFVSSNPWFKRTWIRQEVFASNNLFLSCGKFTFAWATLEYWLQMGDPDRELYTYWSLNSTVGMADRVPATVDTQSYAESETSSWLSAILLHGTRFKTTDDRDKIFVIQNIVEGRLPIARRTMPVVRYDVSFENVCADFIKRYIQRYRNPGFLSIFENREQSLISDLPTWMPDIRLAQNRVFCTRLSYSRIVDTSDPRILSLEGSQIGVCEEQVSLPVTQLYRFDSESTRYSRGAALSETNPALGPGNGLDRFLHDVAYKCCRFASHVGPGHFAEASLVMRGASRDPENADPTQIIVSKVTKPGDLIVCFDPPWSDPKADYSSPNPKQDTQRLVAALRPATARGQYYFLGPCAFLGVGPVPNESRCLQPWKDVKVLQETWEDLHPVPPVERFDLI